MSSVESLREFISERLDAAAERILARYERTVEEYEKTERRRSQTDINRSQTDINRSPQVQLHSLGLPQDPVTTDAEERSSEVKLEGAEPSQVKDEEEELSITQEEQLVLKHEADAVMKTPEEE